jgi:hypothetical protein
MIELIHSILGVRDHKTSPSSYRCYVACRDVRSMNNTRYLNTVKLLSRAGMECVFWRLNLTWCLYYEIIRLCFILFLIIPLLACTFVLLGIFFHLPRMALFYVLMLKGDKSYALEILH